MMKRIREQTILIAILVIILGGIGVTMATGIWSTESTKVPVKFETGDFEGEYNPEDIRGSYTLAEIASIFEIPESILKTAFGIDESVSADSFKSKDLETLYPEEVEIGNDAMKAFVSLYKGIPYELTGLILPDAAVDIILSQSYDFDEPLRSAIERTRYSIFEAQASADGDTPDGENNTLTGTIDNETTEFVNDASDAVENETAHETTEDEPVINGNTTFMQALDAGLSISDIEAVIGGEIPSTAMTIKDFCVNSGLSFSTVKTTLTAKIEALK
ncbi:hypothetical protein KHM83_10085 [Fusibacter paucivorans]|uniref:Uncharacterized protein n=1 Tax=Fusibacter paucivorans TaxID=76009 RepID=A0ABS5PRI5_9FIRM|nr:hypothetical protein [Fusibacter paucivorans]MBS7527029.1 hypothetical protein [Fusibacter paucivorans]